jgi:hypothetical protein
MVPLAAKRRRNSAQGERRGTLGHETQVDASPGGAKEHGLNSQPLERLFLRPFRACPQRTADPGFRLAAPPRAEFLRRFAAIEPGVPDHRVPRYIRRLQKKAIWTSQRHAVPAVPCLFWFRRAQHAVPLQLAAGVRGAGMLSRRVRDPRSTVRPDQSTTPDSLEWGLAGRGVHRGPSGARLCGG